MTRRYRKLALKYHPLKCKEPWGQKRFQQLAEAYDVLSDRKWGVAPCSDCRGWKGVGIPGPWQRQLCDPQPSWELPHAPCASPLHPNKTCTSGWGSRSIPNPPLFSKP